MLVAGLLYLFGFDSIVAIPIPLCIYCENQSAFLVYVKFNCCNRNEIGSL